MVSLSLGDTCVFRFGNTETRTRPYTDVELRSGDLFVFGGPSRLAYHGVPRVYAGTAPPELGLTGRLNVTLRVSGFVGPAGCGAGHGPMGDGPTARTDHGRLAPMSGRGLRGRPQRTRLDRGRGALGPALELVHTGRAPTRAVLTAELGVTRATAGAVAAELEALGLIRVDARPGAAAGSQGRPSHRLDVAEDGPGRPRRAGARRRVPGRAGRPRRPDRRHRARLRDRRRPTRRRCSARSSTPAPNCCASTGRRCVGAGLAVPSAVAEPEGTRPQPAAPRLARGRPGTRDLRRAGTRGGHRRAPAVRRQRRQPRRARRAPARRRPRRPATCSCVATGHRGVGGALVLDGRLHTGSSGLALEVGHLTVNPEGRPCHCGSRGCLDVEADPLAFLTAAGRDPGPEVSLLQQAGDLLRDEYADPAVRSGRRDPDRPAGPRPGRAWSTSSTRTASSSAACTAHLLDADPDRLRAVVADRSLWGRSGGVPHPGLHAGPQQPGRSSRVGVAAGAGRPPARR